MWLAESQSAISLIIYVILLLNGCPSLLLIKGWLAGLPARSYYDRKWSIWLHFFVKTTSHTKRILEC